MTSILTNMAAMSALQTLRSINSGMEETQGRVSSGLRVGEAADNAAYWSIATTMRSDNQALGAVQDALGLGAAKVDTAYAGMESAIDVVDEIKTKLVAAREAGVDRSKIQEEIDQLQDQLKSIADSASFSGENWLKAAIGVAGVDDEPATVQTITKQVVGSFTRDADGTVAVKSINVELNDKTVLFDTTGLNKGILDTQLTLPAADLEDGQVLVTDGDGNEYVVTGIDQDAMDALIAGAVDPADTRTVTAGTDTIRVIDTGPGTGAYLQQGDLWVSLTTTGAASQTLPSFEDVDHDADGGTTLGLDYFIDITGATAVEDEIVVANSSVSALDITKLDEYVTAMGLGPNATEEDALDKLISFVDKQLAAMTSAAADLGSTSMRIEMQEEFVAKLTDSIDAGIGRLVDADMNEESTRLKALQTQQQLGIQALSIANTSSENILSLFR